MTMKSKAANSSFGMMQFMPWQSEKDAAEEKVLNWHVAVVSEMQKKSKQKNKLHENALARERKIE